MHAPRKMLRRLQLAFHERLVMTTLAVTSVNSNFCQNSTCLRIGSRFRCIPIHTDRDAVDERERLRVFGKHWSEHAWDNIAKFSDAKANFFQAGFSITDSGIRRSEGVDCALIQRSARSSMADEVTNSQSD